MGGVAKRPPSREITLLAEGAVSKDGEVASAGLRIIRSPIAHTEGAKLHMPPPLAATTRANLKRPAKAHSKLRGHVLCTRGRSHKPHCELRARCQGRRDPKPETLRQPPVTTTHMRGPATHLSDSLAPVIKVVLSLTEEALEQKQP